MEQAYNLQIEEEQAKGVERLRIQQEQKAYQLQLEERDCMEQERIRV